MYKIIINRSATKELEKISKGDIKAGLKIYAFLKELGNIHNPIALKNIKKLQGYEKRYRWRVGKYRIIGTIENDILQIEIIKIATRQEAYE